MRVTIFSIGRKFHPVSDFYVVTHSYSSHLFLCVLAEYYVLFLRCHAYNHAELVIGTKPPYLFHDPHAPCTTHIKERRKPVSEDHGYGTQELATLPSTQELATLPSDDESEGADEELQAVGDIPDLQVRKKGPQKTVESTQQPAASSSTGPNTPHSTPHSTSHSTPHSTSHYTTVDKSAGLTALVDKPPFSTNCLAPPNNSTKHRLELLDTGQPPGKYDSADSTLGETWCLESSPSLDRHQGELVIVTTSNAIPPHTYTCILPPTYEFVDKVIMEQKEEGYKVVNPVPFFAMAGP